MTFCQKKFPADPSKSVEYNAVKWLLETWEVHGTCNTWNLWGMNINTNNSNVEREALACEMFGLQQNFFVWTETVKLSKCCMVPLDANNCPLKSPQKHVPLLQDIKYLCTRCETSTWRNQYFQTTFLTFTSATIILETAGRYVSFS